MPVDKTWLRIKLILAFFYWITLLYFDMGEIELRNAHVDQSGPLRLYIYIRWRFICHSFIVNKI